LLANEYDQAFSLGSNKVARSERQVEIVCEVGWTEKDNHADVKRESQARRKKHSAQFPS